MNRGKLAVVSSTAAVVLSTGVGTLMLASCGGGSPSAPSTPPPPVAQATPEPTPSPVAASSACQLSAPKIDCSTRAIRGQELAPALQAAVDAAATTGGVMYSSPSNRIYDLSRFRSIVVDHLTAAGLCAAWDYGNTLGDEIFLRSADGCVIEQYDLIAGDGGVRAPGKGSNVWSADFGAPVPAPHPQFARDGDLTCPLPGDRSTFCFSIKNTPGTLGPQVYAAIREVVSENPAMFSGDDYYGGQRDFLPDLLRVGAWRIRDHDGYILALETKLRGRGICATFSNGDILKVKAVALGNVFHEEFDVVLNPSTGGSYLSFAAKDRCHNAGF